MSEAELGTLEQTLCENKGGTNAVMTALAVAAGRELRRWKPETDFKWNTSTGRLELSAAGLARCGAKSSTCVDTWNPVNSTCAQQKSWNNCNASWMGTQCQATCGQCSASSGGGGTCANTQALLDMQKPEANGKVRFPGDIVLDVALLKSKLQAAWNDQLSCNSSGACNAPAHDLKYDHVEDGSCDEKYFFAPLKEGTSQWLSATSANELSKKLRFVGYPSNKMLNFYLRDGKLSVDPTYGLNPDATASVGSCDAACTKFSSSDVSGNCCSCAGATKRYSRSTFNTNVYLCQ
ncbi:MAG TPA: hypothetical protein VMG12_04350 [Polyangiaceae bacterium]|nr:hypothetical protein [Polyangiaceae bacterium]